MLIDEDATGQAVTTVGKALAFVNSIPTVFGRLVYLAAMWDSTEGCYRSDPRAGISCPPAIVSDLCQAHRDVFFEWLALSLERQRRDLMRFADSDGPGAYQCIWSWWSDGFFENLAPASADRHETQLFRNDLECVIKSLSRHAGE